jgi:hypothetical protein
VALPLFQDFNSGTSGTTLTPANTAGVGENAFNAVSVGAGSTGAFSNAHAVHSGLSAVFTTGTAGNPSYASWTTSIGSPGTLYGRAYLYLSASPRSDDTVIRFMDAGVYGGGILIGSNGQLRCANTTWQLYGPTLPAAAWFRLEWKVVAGAAGAGSLTVFYYAAPDTTTVTSTVADIYGAYCPGGAITEVDFGWPDANPSQPAIYFDDLALSGTGYLGPDITATPTAPMADAGGAVDQITVSTTLIAMADAGAAADSAGGALISNAAAMADHAGATDTLTVTQGPYVYTPAATPLLPASPAFIRSQMPRVHAQNLLTGQWLHRDVQGITQPLVTWNLNQPDTFTCTLSPPRPDMLDATGNPLFQAWRDAVYLEENDVIRFGGLITSGTQSGQQWGLGVTGFAGYPNGMPYDGPALTEYNIDAGDVIRYIWAYLQGQPGGNLGLQVSPAKIGTLLGSTVTSMASANLTRVPVAADWTGTYQRIFLSARAQGFSAGMDVSVGGTEFTHVIAVIADAQKNQTGEVHVNGPFTRHHAVGEQVLQIPTNCVLSRFAGAGQNVLWLGNAMGFSGGTVILLQGGKPYTIATIVQDANGVATGQVTLTANLAEGHIAGERVIQAPTPFQMLWWNTPDCGQEIASIQAEAIFDWHEQHTWTSAAKGDVLHQLQFGVPRVGARRADLRFAEGENIIQPVQVTQGGTGFADGVILLGSGSGGAQVRTEISQPSGRIRRVAVYQNQTMTTVARAASIGQKVMAAAEAAIDGPAQIVIANHPNAPFGSFGVGDDIPVQLATGWRSTLFWVRITSIQQDPTTNVMTLTVARSDSFSYMDQSGIAGTV